MSQRFSICKVFKVEHGDEVANYESDRLVEDFRNIAYDDTEEYEEFAERDFEGRYCGYVSEDEDVLECNRDALRFVIKAYKAGYASDNMTEERHSEYIGTLEHILETADPDNDFVRLEM